MFFGEYHHALDEKGRLRIPAKLKTGLGCNYIVCKGTNNCLFVFCKEYFQNEFLTKLNNVPTFSVAGQKSIRALLSSTYEVEEDGQGRVLLPAGLKEFAKISKNVITIGVGNRIEIWSEEIYEQYFSDDASFDDMVKGLDEFNI